MNIIICGAGKVGFSISKQLSAQGHSVTVIDQSSEDIKKINDTQDVKGIVGRASLPSVLENAGAENTDMIIAVTRNDETNMIVCQLASSLFNVSKKIARIRTKDFLEGKWGKLFNKSNIEKFLFIKIFLPFNCIFAIIQLINANIKYQWKKL